VLSTIIVLGVVPGLIAIRNGVLHETKDVSNATMSLDQSYEVKGNELLYTDPRNQNTRQGRHGTAGPGSITEIVTSANKNGPGKMTIIRQDVSNGRLDRRETKWNESRLARTSGSAFIQGNHTTDGREVQTTTKHIENKEVPVQSVEMAPVDSQN